MIAIFLIFLNLSSTPVLAIESAVPASENKASESSPSTRDKLSRWSSNHFVNSLRLSIVDSWNLFQSTRADSATQGIFATAFNNFPVIWHLVSGPISRILYSDPEEVEEALRQPQLAENQDLDLSQIDTMPILDYLKKVKKHIGTLDSNEAIESASEERRKIISLQKRHLETLYLDTSTQLSDFLRETAAKRNDIEKLEVGQLFDLRRFKELAYITLADAKTESQHLARLLKLGRALKITSKFVSILSLQESKQDWGENFLTRPQGLREKLEAVVSLMQTEPDRVHERVHYYFGEPGNGKKSAIVKAAQSSKIPICTVDAEQLTNAWNTKEQKNIPSILKEIIVNCITGSDQHGNPLDSSFPKSLSSYSSPSEVKAPKYAANGWILFHNVDQFLKRAFPIPTEGPIPKAIRRNRRKFATFFKIHADSNNHTIVDPVSGMPVFIGGIKFFKTSTQPYPELDSSSRVYFFQAKDRYETYFVPAPQMSDRLLILSRDKKKLYSKYNFNSIKPYRFNFEHCERTYQEILSFDEKNYIFSGKTLGINGLRCLKRAFYVHVDRNIGYEISQDNLTGNACKDFDVARTAQSCDDYKKGLNKAFEIENFLKELDRVAIENFEQIKNLSNQKVSGSILNALENLKASSHERPVSECSRELAELEKVIDFAITRKVFSRPHLISQFESEFEKYFGYLRSSTSWTSTGKELRKLGGRIASILLNAKAASNRVIVLLQKTPGGTPEETFRNLADTLRLPFCKIENESDLMDVVEPAWKFFTIHSNKQLSGPVIFAESNSAPYKFEEKYHAYVKTVSGRKFFAKPKINFEEDQRWLNSLPEHLRTAVEKYSFAPESKYFTAELVGRDLEDQPIEIYKWWDFCSHQWKTMASQGFVYISDPVQNPNSILDKVNRIHRLVKEQVYPVAGNALIDISWITLIYEPSSIQNTEDMLSSDRALPLDQQKYLTFIVDPLPLDLRSEYAKNIFSRDLNSYPESKQAELKALFQPVLSEIIDFDHQMALRTNEVLPIAAFKEAVYELIFKRVQLHDSDILNLFSELQAPNSVTIQDTLNQLYKRSSSN